MVEHDIKPSVDCVLALVVDIVISRQHFMQFPIKNPIFAQKLHGDLHREDSIIPSQLFGSYCYVGSLILSGELDVFHSGATARIFHVVSTGRFSHHFRARHV